MTKSVKTACTRDCPNTCSLLAKVDNGVVTALVGDPEAPTNKGKVCPKCPKFVRRLYDPDRVLHPLIRCNGRLVKTSWEKALGIICDKLGTLLSVDPETILYYQGFGSRTALKLVNRRFFNLLGPVTLTKGTICGGAGQGAQDLDYGCRISHDINDHENSGLMILWGRNPAATSLNLLPIIKRLKASGRKVILIDPIKTKSAGLCDVHLAPRPGSDAYLALALSRIIMEAGKADERFLTERTEGLEDFKKIVFAQDLAARARGCDLPQEAIKSLASLIMNNKPVSFVLGWGLHRWVNSHITMRSIDALGAVAGSIGVPGGGVSQGFEEYQPYDWSVWGDSLQPENRRKLFMPLLGEELMAADPKIEMAVISAGNPVAMLPDADKVRASLEAVPFKAVLGHFLDDTGILSDVFLPATTFLEEDDVVASYGHSLICPINKAVEPLGESRSDFDVFMALGERMKLNGYVKPREAWLRLIMAPTIKMGVRLEDVIAGGAYQPDIPHVPYQDGIFPTPSGKFRLLGAFEPPAVYDENRRFCLMSVAPAEWLCSEIISSEHPSILSVTVSESVAKEMDLADGEIVSVHNSLGRIEAKVSIMPDLRPDLVVVPRGGWGTKGCNVNVLTRALVTKVGQGTAYYQSRVDISKI